MTLEDQLIRDEGIRLKPYKDTVGKLTIGTGRNLDDVGITDAEARFLLLNDISKVRLGLLTKLPWTSMLDDARRGVLENMAFNMGVDGLTQFKNTLSLIQKGDYDKASVEMLESKWASQVGDRAKRLSNQLRTGDWQ